MQSASVHAAEPRGVQVALQCRASEQPPRERSTSRTARRARATSRREPPPRARRRELRAGSCRRPAREAPSRPVRAAPAAVRRAGPPRRAGVSTRRTPVSSTSRSVSAVSGAAIGSTSAWRTSPAGMRGHPMIRPHDRQPASRARARASTSDRRPTRTTAGAARAQELVTSPEPTSRPARRRARAPRPPWRLSRRRRDVRWRAGLVRIDGQARGAREQLETLADARRRPDRSADVIHTLTRSRAGSSRIRPPSRRSVRQEGSAHSRRCSAGLGVEQ